MKIQNHVAFWIGVFVSAISTISLAYWLYATAEANARDYILVASGATLSLVLLLAVILTFREWIGSKLFRSTADSLGSIVENATKAVAFAASAKPQEAADAGAEAAKGIVAWYSWVSLYRWVLRTAIAVLVAFLGLAGTIVLFEQNDKLERQNRLFELQNDLAAVSMTAEFRRVLSRDQQVYAGYESDIQLHQVELVISSLSNTRWPSPNDSAIASIVRLGNKKRLRDLVIDALIPLLVDVSGTVAAGALLAMIDIGVKNFGHVRIHDVADLDINGSGLSMETLTIEGTLRGEIHFTDSNISDINIRQSQLLEFELKNVNTSDIDFTGSAIHFIHIGGGVHYNIGVSSSIVQQLDVLNIEISPTPASVSRDSPEDRVSKKISSVDARDRSGLHVDFSLLAFLRTAGLDEFGKEGSCVDKWQKSGQDVKLVGCHCGRLYDIPDWEAAESDLRVICTVLTR